MKKFLLWLQLFAFFSFQFIGSSNSQSTAEKKVLWVPLEGTVEYGLAPYIRRAVEYAAANSFDQIVLEVDTFGGLVDAAVQIRDTLLDSKVPVATWINKRAISAGALISLSTKKIFFAPGSTMGAATPIQIGEGGTPEAVESKFVSYFRAEMQSTAEQTGKNPKIAAAMVMAVEDIPGLVKKGEVLTLTDPVALKTKMSDGTASTREELLKLLRLESAKEERFEINWAERIVRFTTDPTVSGLLMSGGVLGLLMELKAPGFGLPGILGISCLTLFFFGKYLVHLAGIEEVLLFIFGFLLLLVEFLLLPGKLIPAATGVVLIIIALFMAGVPAERPWDISFPSIQSHLNGIAFALVATFIGIGFLYYYVSRNPTRSPLVLGDTLASTAYRSADNFDFLLGQGGRTLTGLRPTGKAQFGEKTYEVVTRGEFIPDNEEIEVAEIEGMRIVVQKKKLT